MTERCANDSAELTPFGQQRSVDERVSRPLGAAIRELALADLCRCLRDEDLIMDARRHLPTREATAKRPLRTSPQQLPVRCGRFVPLRLERALGLAGALYVASCSSK